MRKLLEEDEFLFQQYDLAAQHDWPLAVVRRMDLAEFYGWLEYHKMRGDLKPK